MTAPAVEALQWRLSDNQQCWTALTTHIYQIIQHADHTWQLRVRNREQPQDVPLDDLWVTLGFYRDPAVAMIHANCHNDKEA